jgi:hypothetical protein
MKLLCILVQACGLSIWRSVATSSGPIEVTLCNYSVSHYNCLLKHAWITFTWKEVKEERRSKKTEHTVMTNIGLQ